METNVNNAFALRLQELMVEKKVTLQKLAESVDVSHQVISLWKSGKAIPSINNFKKIAKFFDVSYDYLIGDVNNRKHENMIIVNELGLCDDAIDTIKWASEKNENEFTLNDILNDCLKSTLFREFLGYTLEFFSSYAYFRKNEREYVDDSLEPPDISLKDEIRFSKYKAEEAIKTYLSESSEAFYADYHLMKEEEE